MSTGLDVIHASRSIDCPQISQFREDLALEDSFQILQGAGHGGAVEDSMIIDQVDVHLIYDHRVLDGTTVARALEDLERVLKCEVLTELRYLRAVNAA